MMLRAGGEIGTLFLVLQLLLVGCQVETSLSISPTPDNHYLFPTTTAIESTHTTTPSPPTVPYSPVPTVTSTPPSNVATRRLHLDSGEAPPHGSDWYPAAWQAAVSSDGRYVVHVYGWPEPANIMLHDLQTTTTTLVSASPDGSAGDGLSVYPTISADGSILAFASTASNLVENPYEDCDEQQSPFETFCYSIYVVDVTGGTLQRIGRGYRPVLSDDGLILAYYRTDHQATESVIYDLSAGAVSQSLEDAIVMDMSGDGELLAYVSTGNDHADGGSRSTDVFVYDRNTNRSERISRPVEGLQAEGTSGIYIAAPSGPLSSGGGVGISADGRYVVFGSTLPNLTRTALPTCSGHVLTAMEAYEGGCPQFYLYDRQTQQMEIVSLSNEGRPADGNAFGNGDVSSDGRFVVFTSTAHNLWPAPPAACSPHVDRPCAQVFVRDRQEGVTYLIGEGPGSIAPNQAGSAIASEGLLAVSWLEADVHESAIDEDVWDVLVTDLQELTAGQ